MGVPSNILVPFVGMDFDDSRAVAGPANLPINFLIIGQKTSGGSGAVETPILVSDPDVAGQIAGPGSLAHRMAIRAFENNKITNTYMILLADAAGTAAVTSLVLTGTATADGEFRLYVNGTRIAVSVLNTETAAEVGAKIVAAVNLLSDLPVVAADTVPGTVTLTAKNAGVAAGDIDVRYNYNAKDVIPAGITAAAPATVAGTVDPDIQDAIDAIGDMWVNIIASPYDDATNMEAMEVFLTAQNDILIQKMGICYSAKKDTRANLITFATNSSRNSQFMVLIPNTSRPCSNAEMAAGYAAAVAYSVEVDPAVPLHRITLQGFLPVANADRWTLLERNQLVANGLATVSDDNGVQTEGTVTMYLKNSAAAASVSYQFQNTIYKLMRSRYTFVNWIVTRYPRAKLAQTADRMKSGQQVMTPGVGKSEAVAWFLAEEYEGQVENVDQFKKELVCRISATNGNRMEWLMSPKYVNMFIVGSVDNQFLLNQPTV